MKIRLGIFGAGGAMGREVARTILESDSAELGGAFERDGSGWLGMDAGIAAGVGACGVPITEADKIAEANLRAMIDFSTPSGSLRCAKLCAENGIALAVGVTGFTPEERAELERHGKKIPLVIAANMSAGINAMADAVARAATLLRAGNLGGGFDIEVFEAHHRRKKDAPSGTALYLGEILAKATNADLKKRGVFTRHGREEARLTDEIGFSVARGGDIAGEHRVIFAGEGEVLEITHRAGTRASFARGALRAALFAANAKQGVHGMPEVLAE